ncbi:MAG: hypothetical protein AAF337_14330 [Pseudomonadota bacterium]
MASWLLLSALCLPSAVAQPATAKTAAQLQAEGAWQEAIVQGRLDGDSAGLIAAAKASLFLAAYQLTDKDAALDVLRGAIGDAQSAVALEPDNNDANLQLAIGEGYLARIKTSPKRGKAARARAAAILERSPGDAYALGFLGGWHGEAIGSYGAIIAKVGIGAEKSAFTRYFDAALEAAPNNALITAYYARLLLDINDKGMRERAVEILIDIESAEPADAFEAFMKERALALKAALQTGDKKQLKRLVKAQRALRNLK